MKCRYFKECCILHDILYDRAVLLTERPEDFAGMLNQADEVFERCMKHKIKEAPRMHRWWLRTKAIIFLFFTTWWAEKSIRKVMKAGGVYKAYYLKEELEEETVTWGG